MATNGIGFAGLTSRALCMVRSGAAQFAWTSLNKSAFKRSMPSGLIRGWRPIRVKKTRQIKNPEPRFDSIETEKP